MATSTGWSLEYIKWHVSWPELQMMIADAPRYESNKGKVKEISNKQEAKKFFGIA